MGKKRNYGASEDSPDACFWLPQAGEASDNLLDIYRLPVGIRTLEVKGAQFLVNGEPHYFRGTDCHQVRIWQLDL